jgi:hypothetical protein
MNIETHQVYELQSNFDEDSNMDEKQDDSSSNEISSLKLTIDDFVEIKVIGLGAQGKVTLA